MCRRVQAVVSLAFLAASLSALGAAQAVETQAARSNPMSSQNPVSGRQSGRADESTRLTIGNDASSLYLKVQLDSGLKVSKLKPGDVVAGKLRQPIYLGDRELYPTGSLVHLTVSGLQRERRQPNDYWPWVIKAFTPRHRNRPNFESARIVLADNHEVPIEVRLISFGKEREVHAKPKKGTTVDPAPPAGESLSVSPTSKSARAKMGPVVVLEGETADPEQVATELRSSRNSEPETIAAGTPAKIILLGDVSASKNHAGDSIQARLIEPVRLGTTVVLPEGSLLRGQIVKSQPPRVLSRAGSVMLRFTTLTIPGGNPVPIAASIGGADLSQRSHTVIDPEGMMRGDRPGKAWMLLNIGVTSGIAKEADDGTQLLIEALVSTATDASTAGVAKIASACASGIFMLTRHGRDVVLPKYTEMQIVFDRPVELPALIAAR